MPKDHLLRRIDKHIDFPFIKEKVRPLYCPDNGGPCINPVLLVNIAYRWFLGLDLSDPIPHHSVISQNRIRRFNGATIFQEIFDAIVLQAIRKGLIDGKELFTDSTHLKANANKNKFNVKKMKKSTLAYIEELDKAVERDRKRHGKKPLAPKDHEADEKETRVSATDPESGFMVRDGKPQGFFYLDHVTVDGKFNLITDVFVTPGNVHDSIPCIERRTARSRGSAFLWRPSPWMPGTSPYRSAMSRRRETSLR